MHVHSLYQFPVKSLASDGCDALGIDDWGPVGDRRWMVVDSEGRFVTQRQCPAMCRLRARWQRAAVVIDDLNGRQRPLTVAVPDGQPATEVTVWADTCAAWDGGDNAALWLSQALGREVRLCYMPDSAFRQVDLNFAQPGDRVGFADGFPFLICHLESLQAIETALGRALAMERFRPNIVVAGGAAFAERQWRQLRIGSIDFELVKPCTRCAIPTIDPATGQRQRDVFEVLRALCSQGKDVYFGQNAVHRGQGRLSVGDPVSIEL